MYRAIDPTTMLDAGDMSQATLTTTFPLKMSRITAAFLDISWTGSPFGTFSVQGSVDGVTYRDMGISVKAAAGSPDGTSVDITKTGANFIQVVYTKASGSGALTVVGSAKGE